MTSTRRSCLMAVVLSCVTPSLSELVPNAFNEDILCTAVGATGGPDNDCLTGHGAKKGGLGNDIIRGDGTLYSTNMFYGGPGDDHIIAHAKKVSNMWGSSGDDVLVAAGAVTVNEYGGQGNDILLKNDDSKHNALLWQDGEAGSDLILPGSATYLEVMKGGDGDDVFYLKALPNSATSPIIVDFATGFDHICLPDDITFDDLVFKEVVPPAYDALVGIATSSDHANQLAMGVYHKDTDMLYLCVYTAGGLAAALTTADFTHCKMKSVAITATVMAEDLPPEIIDPTTAPEMITPTTPTIATTPIVPTTAPVVHTSAPIIMHTTAPIPAAPAGGPADTCDGYSNRTPTARCPHIAFRGDRNCACDEHCLRPPASAQDQCLTDGCAQCAPGHWTLDKDHWCTICNIPGCLFCQDHDGCAGCREGWTRVFDEQCGHWKCEGKDRVKTCDKTATLSRQCGGVNFTGDTCCKGDNECVYYSQWYSQCKKPAVSSQGCIESGSRCKTEGYNTEYQCCGGLECVQKNKYYAECIPKQL